MLQQHMWEGYQLAVGEDLKKSLCSLPLSFHCSVIHKCQNTTGNSGLLLKSPCPILQIKFVDMSQGVSHDGGRGEGVVCPYCMFWSW